MQNANDATEPLPASESTPWQDLRQRIISAALLGIAVLTLTAIGGIGFKLLIFCAGLQMIREWDKLTETEGKLWHIVGVMYVALPCLTLIWLRDYETPITALTPSSLEGLALVLYVFFVVWATDIGAFFAGRMIGGPKLASAISPKKTWAGLGGGMVAAAITGACFLPFVIFPTTFPGAIFISMLLAVVSQVGDLFESWLKRRVGVKDSGSLIPGHGGVLDRVDGLTFSAPLFALLVFLYAGGTLQ